MKKIIISIAFAALAAAFMTGCITTAEDIDLQCTNTWENHYMTVEEFKSGTSNITLKSNESIWVLSNATLNRLLTNEKRSAQ